MIQRFIGHGWANLRISFILSVGKWSNEWSSGAQAMNGLFK